MAQPTPNRDSLLLADFATLFSHMWYRDFPLHPAFHRDAQRADWTTHIGLTVRSTADLMGLFTCFESGERNDAVLRNNQSKAVAVLEWEWESIHNGDEVVTEFNKLKRLCSTDEFRNISFACLIGYARCGRGGPRRKPREFETRVDYSRLSAEVHVDYQLRWVPDSDLCGTELPPLLLVLIHYWQVRNKREFLWMTIEAIKDGNGAKLRTQPSYPWEVNGSRWSVQVDAINEKR